MLHHLILPGPMCDGIFLSFDDIYHDELRQNRCRKLMGRHGVCEMEVDQLLRNEVFVDTL